MMPLKVGRRRANDTTEFSRLGHFFGTSAEFWLNPQELYDLRLAEQKAGDAIKHLPTLDKGSHASI
jgi:antitoxin HigA-1